MTTDRVASPLSRHFASLLERLAPDDPPLLRELAMRLVAAGEGGDSCLDLTREPGVEERCALLLRSPLVGEGGEWRPLILDGGRLYLQRRWQEEHDLAAEFLRRATAAVTDVDDPLLRAGLARLFGDEADDEQARAAECAVRRSFCVISGGPGTGKTTTVVKVLALLLEQQRGAVPRIALAAPTGKAAARLRQAIEAARDALPCAPSIRDAIPTATVTLHRLLGAGRRPGTFRYGRDEPLPVEVVVVDEASMVDLTLMSRLLAALPKAARLILLGDRDQLASVEAGAVLADLCAAPEMSAASPLHGAVATLTRSRRFAGEGGIGALCRAVNGGDAAAALELLRGADPALSWRDLPDAPGLGAALSAEVVAGFKPLLAAASPDEALARLGDFALLTALRQGPFGVPALNQIVERLLARHGAIDPRDEWYLGRPLMIVRNDPAQDLFNGDLGLVLRDPADGRPRAFFSSPGGGVRAVAPLRLPPHETAFAMTVHKSQGSEFGRIVLVLPPQEVDVVSRELIYTGISRARHSLAVWGREEPFCQGVARRVERHSGLRARLCRG